MRDIVKELKQKKERARISGGLKRQEAQHAKGKLTARERIEVLADKDSFVEYDMFVEHRSTDFGMEKNKIPGDVISAIINGTKELVDELKQCDINIHMTGGETAAVSYTHLTLPTILRV